MKNLYGFILISLLILPLLLQPTAYQVLKMRTFDRLVETPEESGHFAITKHYSRRYRQRRWVIHYLALD